MPSEPPRRARKPRPGHKPYHRSSQPREKHTTPSAKHARSNLTLHDWLDVVAYHDSHQPISQTKIVTHFATRKETPLIFDQSSLSRHLSEKGRREDQAHLESHPSALSAKRVRVVTRPDVEAALVEWVKRMQEKGEHVTGPMLITERQNIENAMNVPEAERLRSNGWVTNFRRTYNLKESRKRGGDASAEAREDYFPLRSPSVDEAIPAEVENNIADIQTDSGDSDREETEPGLQIKPEQGLAICAQFLALCLQNASADHIDLATIQRQLRHLSAHLEKEIISQLHDVDSH